MPSWGARLGLGLAVVASTCPAFAGSHDASAQSTKNAKKDKTKADPPAEPASTDKSADAVPPSTAPASDAQTATTAPAASDSATAPASANSSHLLGAPWYVAVGPYFYSDSGSIDSHEVRAISVFDDHQKFKSDGLWGLWLEVTSTPFGEHFRFGGMLRYYLTYTYIKADDTNPNPQVFDLGKLLELTARADALIPLGKSFQVGLGLDIGPAMLIPGGQLRDDIDAYRKSGVAVWDLPRLGIVGGPHVGARYALGERVAIRLEAALMWEHLYLLGTSDTVDGINVELHRSADMQRGLVGVGVEFSL